MILKIFIINCLLTKRKMILKKINIVIKFLKKIPAILMYWKLLINILIIDYFSNLLESEVLKLFTNLDCRVRIIMV